MDTAKTLESKIGVFRVRAEAERGVRPLRTGRCAICPAVGHTEVSAKRARNRTEPDLHPYCSGSSRSASPRRPPQLVKDLPICWRLSVTSLCRSFSMYLGKFGHMSTATFMTHGLTFQLIARGGSLIRRRYSGQVSDNCEFTGINLC
jgi:hypothetical protein